MTSVGQSDRSVSMERKPVSDRIVQLSIKTVDLATTTEAVASHASYGGTESQVDGLLRLAAELRSIAAEMEALR